MTAGIDDERAQMGRHGRAGFSGNAARFVQHLADLPAPAFLADAHGRYRWVNPAFTELAGHSAEELVNGAATGVPADVAARSAAVLPSGQPVRLAKVRFPQPAGPPRWASGMAFTMDDDDEMLVAGALEEISDGDGIGSDVARLLAQTPAFILTTDNDLRYTWSVGTVSERLGCPRPLVGRTAWEVLETTDPTHPTMAPLLRALQGAEVYHQVHLRGLHLDVHVGPLRDGSGDIVGTVAAVVDVSDAEIARQRQRVAEERFRLLVEHSPAIIGIRDADDRVVHANPAFLRSFGLELGEVLGRRYLVAGGSGDGADLAETENLVRATGRPRVWQGRVPRSDGHLVDLLGHVFPMPVEDGGTGIGEVFVDVSAQERSRRELAESEQRFRAIFTGAEIGIVMLDLDARIVDANPAAVRLTGRTVQDLRGRFVGVAMTKADVEHHAPLWLELIAGRRSRYDVSVTLRSMDGRHRPARLTVTLVRDRDGAPAFGLGVAMPLTPDSAAIPVPARSRPSPGEAAVLERLAVGNSLQQIATDLGMSRRGVDYRITRLRHKLRTDGPGGAPANSAALVARAYALGILHPATWPPRVVDQHQDPTVAPREA